MTHDKLKRFLRIDNCQDGAVEFTFERHVVQVMGQIKQGDVEEVCKCGYV